MPFSINFGVKSSHSPEVIYVTLLKGWSRIIFYSQKHITKKISSLFPFKEFMAHIRSKLNFRGFLTFKPNHHIEITFLRLFAVSYKFLSKKLSNHHVLVLSHLYSTSFFLFFCNRILTIFQSKKAKP